MSICNICGTQLPRDNKGVCPECGKMLATLSNTFILPPRSEKRCSASVYFRENSFAYRVSCGISRVFSSGLHGGSFAAADVCGVDYPVYAKGFRPQCTIALNMNDGRSFVVWVGSRKKTAELYALLRERYVRY